MPNIRLYQITDRDAWNAYVTGHPQGSLFHLTPWKEVVEQTFAHRSFYLIAEPENTLSGDTHPRITGILPLFEIKSRLFGRYLVSVPFAELGGILADDEQSAAALLARAQEITRNLDLDYLELRHRAPVAGLETKDLYYNFKREIYPDLDDNLQAIPRKARRMIRQGYKHGLTMEMGHHLLPEFYHLLARNYHHLGTPIFSRRFFLNFLKIFGDKAYILLVREPGGLTIGGVLGFTFRGQVIPYYAGSLVAWRKLAPNDFMYWELLKWGHENGCREFDFGRSKIDTGSYNFKRHWGFEPQPLSYQYYLHRLSELPNLSPANPKYKRKIELWRKMPLPLTKLIGPQLSRYLA